MPIDVATEHLLTMKQTTREPGICNADGSPCHIAKCHRLRTLGIKAPDGFYVRLEAVRLPSGWHTSREAVHRFIAKLNQPPPRAFPRRERETANAKLAAAGLPRSSATWRTHDL